MKLAKKLIILLLLTASVLVVFGCKTTIRTDDMIKERVVQYYYWSMAGGGPEILFETKPINEGDTFVNLEGPEIAGYTFEGWYMSTPNWTKMNEGDALPEKGGIKVHANYVPNVYDVEYIVNGVSIKTEQIHGAYTFESQHVHIDSYDNIAQKLSQASGKECRGDYLYLNGYYLDADYTQPLTDGTNITQATNIYVKYDYVPVLVGHFENAIITYVDNEVLQQMDGKLVLPAKTQYNNAIVGFNDSLFQYNSYIKELVIPEGYTSIPDHAFEGSSIEKVVIPSTVEYIGEGAFNNCTALTSVTINTVADFDVENVFAGCENIVYEEYGNCYYLGKYFISLIAGDVTSVEIRPTCQVIPANAFANSQIQSVTIPASVTAIGSGAFSNCTALVTVIVNSDIDLDIESIFDGCINLKGEEYGNAYYIGKYFIAIKSQDVTSVQIKPGCEEIPANAFANSQIQSVTIPASVKVIGENAFAGTQLTAVEIPATVEEIGSGAFKDCLLLQDVTINATIEISFSDVFENCNAIAGEEYGNAYYLGDTFIRPVSKDIVWAEIKPTCKFIPENAFKDCTQLSRVYVPASVESVGEHAFYNVNSLYFACYFEGTTNAIDFAVGSQETIHPDSGTLLNLTFYLMPQNVKLDDKGIAYAVDNLLPYTGQDLEAVIVYGYFGDAEEVVVEEKYDGVTVGLIFQNVFMGTTSVRKVTIKACYVIGSAAFWNATSIEEIILPQSGCAQIGVRAFYGCTNLKKVTIGSGVVFIGKLAFENCTSLQEVKCATALKSWTDDAVYSQGFDANENIAAALSSTDLNNWFFNDVYTQEQVAAVLATTGL